MTRGLEISAPAGERQGAHRVCIVVVAQPPALLLLLVERLHGSRAAFAIGPRAVSRGDHSLFPTFLGWKFPIPIPNCFGAEFPTGNERHFSRFDPEIPLHFTRNNPKFLEIPPNFPK